MQLVFLHPKATVEMLGLIPAFLSDSGEPAKEQLHRNYSHGGGWKPFQGFTFDTENLCLNYPGDRPMAGLAMWTLESTQEEVYLFEYSWVMVRDIKTGAYEIARMD